MIYDIRNSIYTQFLCGIMGLYLLNISVDAPDLTPIDKPEDLSFNDQESIIEIVVEQVLGYEDAIKEYDDNDTKDHNKKKNTSIDLLYQQINSSELFNENPSKTKKTYFDYKNMLINGFRDNDFPPPKIQFV